MSTTDTARSAAEWVDPSTLTAWDKNPRNNDPAVESVAKSIERFGFGAPIVARLEDRMVIAGHTRLKAAALLQLERVPVRFLDISPAEAKALALADNKLGELAAWNDEMLAEVLRELDADEIDLDGLGFSDSELDDLLAEPGAGGGGGGEDEAPPVQPGPAHSKLGKLYELGPHRLACGDSTSPTLVERLLDGDPLAVLLHADPPYGMGKEGEGVLNDNLYREKLDAFQMTWIRVWLEHMAPNSSLYIWGNAPDLWRLWYCGGLDQIEDGGLLVRNDIVWDKGSGFGMKSGGMHSYSVSTERCLFLMRGQQFPGNQNKEDFWEGYRPLLDWMLSEIKLAGWTKKDVGRITGTSMAGHWFGESQFHIISEDRYLQLQKAAEGRAFAVSYNELFARVFPELRDGGNAHKRWLAEQVRSGRSYFDNTHEVMTEVWQFPRVAGDERHGHATPKPVKMVARALISSSPDGAIVLEPFGGSGSTLIAAAMCGRTCRTVELDPHYCDVIRRRWTTWAREHGQDPGPGALD